MMQSALEKVLNNKHESRRKREVPGELNFEFYDVESQQVRQMSFNYKWSRSDHFQYMQFYNNIYPFLIQ